MMEILDFTGNKWGTFQLSAGYILFDDNSSNNLFGLLKVRGSWGNQEMPNWKF